MASNNWNGKQYDALSNGATFRAATTSTAAWTCTQWVAQAPVALTVTTTDTFAVNAVPEMAGKSGNIKLFKLTGRGAKLESSATTTGGLGVTTPFTCPADTATTKWVMAAAEGATAALEDGPLCTCQGSANCHPM